MRVVYIPEDTNFWSHSLHEDQYGGNLAAFIGHPYQRGAGIGSFFRSLFRMAVPVLKNVAKTVGKQALVTAMNVAGDALQTGEVLPALEKHGKEGLANVLDKVKEKVIAGTLGQQGSGYLGKRKRQRRAKVVRKSVKGRRKRRKIMDILG